MTNFLVFLFDCFVRLLAVMLSETFFILMYRYTTIFEQNSPQN